jgi:adenylate cyclase
MSDPGFRQRLAAILAADAAGYSRLMSGDERAAVALLDAAREVFRRYTESSQGRVIDMAGDSVLAVFETAAGSVSAALAIQKEVNASAEVLPEDRRMHFRIGIHLGDVIEKPDGTVYGDGVNIAARLQAMAEPGGISVSDSIRSAVRGKLAADFDDQGERSFKNIADPVRVWRMRQAGGAPEAVGTTHSTERASAGLPVPPAGGPGVLASSKPSIAVRPFTNMSGDPEQQYFSDGITEDIITDLSKISGLMVIARNTSFAQKYKGADVRAVGHELGVSSMLEGSIRRAGMRVRITAQLVDTATGTHLWAERFDRDVTDIFAIQDEVTRQIVDALAVALRPAERALLASSHTPSVESHDRFLFGHELLRASRDLTLDVFNRIVEAFEQAIALDSAFAGPYAGLAMAYCLDFQNHLSGTPDVLDVAAHFAAQAIEKGPDEPLARFVAANVAIWRRDLLLARVESDRALALNPNYAMAYSTRGNIEVYLGTPLAGIPYIQRAMLLDPFFTHQNQHFLGTAYLVAGQFEAAVASLRERVRLSPKTDLSRAFLVSALGHLGELDEARRVWDELRAINPKYSLAEHLARLPFQVDADRDRIREGVAKAGLLVDGTAEARRSAGSF